MKTKRFFSFCIIILLITVGLMSCEDYFDGFPGTTTDTTTPESPETKNLEILTQGSWTLLFEKRRGVGTTTWSTLYPGSDVRGHTYKFFTSKRFDVYLDKWEDQGTFKGDGPYVFSEDSLAIGVLPNLRTLFDLRYGYTISKDTLTLRGLCHYIDLDLGPDPSKDLEIEQKFVHNN